HAVWGRRGGAAVAHAAEGRMCAAAPPRVPRPLGRGARYPERVLRRSSLLALCLWSGFAVGVRGPQDPAPVASADVALPPPLTEYMGRRIAQTMHWSGADWLLRETRESEEHTSHMIAALGLHKGDVVCDFGCGVGYVTLPMAKLVAPAKVLAVDLQP